jgi:hypothetical protein
MLGEHKAVAMLLAVIAIGCAVYGWRAVHAHRAPRYPAKPAQPIYIVPIPDQDPP